MCHLLFLQQRDLVFLLSDGGGMGVFLREVSVALDLVLFDEAAEHEDGWNLIVLHHPPEVVEAVSEGSLSGNASFALQLDHIGIDVVLDLLVVLIGSDSCAGGLEGHESGITIEGELFWVFV